MGTYELAELLGRGGMAEVWTAHDGRLHRPVAITLLATNLAQYIASASSHQELLSAETVLRLLTPLSLALDYAHHQGTIHRAIKPSNIPLDQRNTTRTPIGEPMLTGFGLAKVLTGSSHTMTGTPLGTPVYMSPEQIVAIARAQAATVAGVRVEQQDALSGRRVRCGALYPGPAPLCARGGARMLVTPARVPEEWPPTRGHADEALLHAYSQHLVTRVTRRDWALQRRTAGDRGATALRQRSSPLATFCCVRRSRPQRGSAVGSGTCDRGLYR